MAENRTDNEQETGRISKKANEQETGRVNRKADEQKTERGPRKRMGLTTQIFLALVLGGAVGAVINSGLLGEQIGERFLAEGLFLVIGQGFIRLMRMLVVPLVFCSLVCGSMSAGDTKKLGRTGGKTLAFYLCTTAVAVSIALALGVLLRPGSGLKLTIRPSGNPGQETLEAAGFAQTLLNIIPANIFEALSDGIMLQIIVFALLLGVILGKMGARVDNVKHFFTQFNDIMMEMTLIVMKLAPVGVFSLIANTFAQIGFDALIPLMKYVACVLIGLAVHCLIIYMGLLKGLARLSPLVFLRKFFPVMAFAFSTSASNAAIPMSIETLEEKMGVSGRIASFTIPLGATINMDGTSILQGVAVVFTAQAFGIQLGPMDYLTVIGTATLASIGTAGIPGVGLITLTMVFHAVGLPVEGIALIMGIDRILDMARTAVNVTGDAVCTMIVAAGNGEVDREIFYGE